jgi:hypothetical protein
MATPTANEPKAMVQIDDSDTNEAELGATFCDTPDDPEAVAVHC